MIEDVQAALLGDHEAARRLTEAGVLVPCPFCGGNNISERESACLFGRSAYQRTYKYVFARTAIVKLLIMELRKRPVSPGTPARRS